MVIDYRYKQFKIGILHGSEDLIKMIGRSIITSDSAHTHPGILINLLSPDIAKLILVLAKEVFTVFSVFTTKYFSGLR